MKKALPIALLGLCALNAQAGKHEKPQLTDLKECIVSYEVDNTKTVEDRTSNCINNQMIFMGNMAGEETTGNLEDLTVTFTKSEALASACTLTDESCDCIIPSDVIYNLING